MPKLPGNTTKPGTRPFLINMPKYTINGRGRRRRQPGAVSLERLPTHKLLRTTVRTLAQIATDQGYVIASDPNAEVADWSNLSNCFDQYRVAKVELRFTLPRSDATEFPTLYFAPDFNDSFAPASRADMLNYETLRVHQFAENRRVFSYSYVPKQRLNLGGSLDAAVTAQTWAHTSQNPLWLGSKFFLTQYNSTSNSTAIIEVHSVLHLEFKNSR